MVDEAPRARVGEVPRAQGHEGALRCPRPGRAAPVGLGPPRAQGLPRAPSRLPPQRFAASIRTLTGPITGEVRRAFNLAVTLAALDPPGTPLPVPVGPREQGPAGAESEEHSAGPYGRNARALMMEPGEGHPRARHCSARLALVLGPLAGWWLLARGVIMGCCGAKVCGAVCLKGEFEGKGGTPFISLPSKGLSLERRRSLSKR